MRRHDDLRLRGGCVDLSSVNAAGPGPSRARGSDDGDVGAKTLKLALATRLRQGAHAVELAARVPSDRALRAIDRELPNGSMLSGQSGLGASTQTATMAEGCDRNMALSKAVGSTATADGGHRS